MNSKISIFSLSLFIGVILITSSCNNDDDDQKKYCNDQTSTNIIYHDYDNDGDMDISAVALYHVKVFENDGAGNFIQSCVYQVDETWDSRNTIGSRLIAATSLDNDNIENDIVGYDDYIYNDENGSNRRNISLKTYTDLGTENANFHSELLWDVSWPENNFDVFEKVRMEDVDKDGLKDLIYNYTEEYSRENVWHENLGDGTFATTSNLFPALEFSNNATTLYFEDLDNDNEKEIFLFDNFNRLGKWYSFSGNMELLSSMNIGDRRGRSAVFEDMNGDGLKDIIMQMEDYELHLLYRNPNDMTKFLYSENGFMPMGGDAINYYIADIDGDAKNDILIHNPFDNNWKWIRNEIGTVDWEWSDNNQVDISILDTNNFSNLLFEDVDSDGDTDFLVLYEEFDICLFKNNNGSFQKIKLN